MYYQSKNQLEFKYSLKTKTAIQIDDKTQTETQLLEFIKNGYQWFSENGNFTLEDYLGYLNIDFTNISNIENLSTNHLKHFFTKINQIDCLWLYNTDFFTLFENKVAGQNKIILVRTEKQTV